MNKKLRKILQKTLLNIEGLGRQLYDQVGDIDNKKYHEAKQYFQEQQNNLRAESYNQ